jgi:hypothetical protein
MRIAAVIACLGVLALAPQGAGGDTNGPAAPATEGRRLLKEGRLAEAATKLSDAWATSSADAEVLFDLATCYERLGRTVEAVAAFRRYLTLPLALRLREAEDRIRAIESAQEPRDKAAPPAPGPRRVLVPVGGDGGKCFRDCTRGYCGRRGTTPHRCMSTQFVCLRTCPGARVESGTCVTALVPPGEKCRTEGGAF